VAVDMDDRTVHSDQSYYWANRWTVTKENDPNKKIWSVDYAMVASGKSSQTNAYNIGNTRTEFEDIVTSVASFANKNDLNFWADFFNKSLKVLSSEKPIENFFTQT
jgi:hypothetical protein